MIIHSLIIFNLIFALFIGISEYKWKLEEADYKPKVFPNRIVAFCLIYVISFTWFFGVFVTFLEIFLYRKWVR